MASEARKVGKMVVIADEGFEDAPLAIIQREGIQPAYVYGDGPWVVSETPMSDEEVAVVLDGQDEDDDEDEDDEDDE